MFIDRLLNQTNAPLLEQTVKFASARHKLILANIANVDTPNYRQADLSVKKFQGLLAKRIEERRRVGKANAGFEGVGHEVENPTAGILFHDRNNRSMEHLASDMAKNAMMHNLAVELLRKQYQSLETALRERIQ
jgi:flagellar basal-body rod protein FlgB